MTNNKRYLQRLAIGAALAGTVMAGCNWSPIPIEDSGPTEPVTDPVPDESTDDPGAPVVIDETTPIADVDPVEPDVDVAPEADVPEPPVEAAPEVDVDATVDADASVDLATLSPAAFTLPTPEEIGAWFEEQGITLPQLPPELTEAFTAFSQPILDALERAFAAFDRFLPDFGMPEEPNEDPIVGDDPEVVGPDLDPTVDPTEPVTDPVPDAIVADPVPDVPELPEVTVPDLSSLEDLPGLPDVAELTSAIPTGIGS